MEMEAKEIGVGRGMGEEDGAERPRLGCKINRLTKNEEKNPDFSKDYVYEVLEQNMHYWDWARGHHFTFQY